MKTSKIVAAALLSLTAVAGAHAEEYQGAQPLVSGLSVAEVQQQAVAAARAPNRNIPAASISQGPLVNGRDRASVRAEAIAAAHDSTQNLEAGAFTDSQIPTALRSAHTTNRQAAL